MNNHNHHSKYRADIDGLRALAIVPVVLFHAFPNLMPGGFVGVDVFFVISGFLISTIIFGELKKGDFSFLSFYGRRARRLFPALGLVLIASLIFGWWVLDAEEYKMLGKHVAAGAGFVQNFVLWGEIGYFDINSDLKPLLHLWSLAIEEQFYLLFPLLVWGAWRIGINLLVLVSLVAIASLGANLYWVGIDPSGAFYFPHTRVWELMAGAILAALALRPTAVSESIGIKDKSLLSVLGLGLILAAAFTFDKNHDYPGWRAIAPVLGAVLIIHAGKHSWVNRRVFGNQTVVFIGLISYPLYLWHWPLLSFARIIEFEPLTVSTKLALVSLSVLLAILTYYLVEKPVRVAKSPRFWTTVLFAVMTFVAAIGILVFQRELPSKLGASVQELKRWDSQQATYEESCAELFPEWNNRRDGFKCSFLGAGKPEIVVIGDSHARRTHYGIEQLLGDEHNTAIFPMGCAMPFYDISVAVHVEDKLGDYPYPRTKLMDNALDFSINDPAVKLVVLSTSACWKDIIDVSNPLDENPFRVVEKKMRLTFEKLTQSGKQVIYVLDNPLLNFDPKACTQRPFRIGLNEPVCKMPRAVFDQQRVHYFRIGPKSD